MTTRWKRLGSHLHSLLHFAKSERHFLTRLIFPPRHAWRTASNDDVWIRLVSQVVVVGRAEPAEHLREKDVRRRIAWGRVTEMSDRVAANNIWQVLQDIGTRYCGRNLHSCRKTAALMRNLEYLKRYPKGPKGFLRDVATLKGSSRDKAAFISKRLSYIKNKGARDFLITGFGLVKDRIALDSRILSVLRLVGIEIPDGVQSDPIIYDAFRTALDRTGLSAAWPKWRRAGSIAVQKLQGNQSDVWEFCS